MDNGLGACGLIGIRLRVNAPMGEKRKGLTNRFFEAILRDQIKGVTKESLK